MRLLDEIGSVVGCRGTTCTSTAELFLMQFCASMQESFAPAGAKIRESFTCWVLGDPKRGSVRRRARAMRPAKRNIYIISRTSGEQHLRTLKHRRCRPTSLWDLSLPGVRCLGACVCAPFLPCLRSRVAPLQARAHEAPTCPVCSWIKKVWSFSLIQFILSPFFIYVCFPT